MLVNRAVLVVLGFGTLALSGAVAPERAKVGQQPRSDWKKAKFDVVAVARKAESMFPTFRMVACGVTLQIKAPLSLDPTGRGQGVFHMNEYFWGPGRFRIEYVAYPKPKMERDSFGNPKLAILPPTTEYLASDQGKMLRLGPAVGTSNTVYTPSQKVFDAPSDAALVESWPINFTKLLFSPFAKGNATLTRYVSAVMKGVGGYASSTSTRQVTVQGRAVTHYRWVAERPAKGKTPASKIEMIFQAGAPFLPISIHTTYGPKYDLHWSGQWYNNANLPGEPFKINQ